jgi:predicted amidophosphoribosyltransferase
MPCKGVWIHHKALGPYASGYKLCKECSLFIKWDGLWCPCCGYKLRTGPRKLKYKIKLRAQKTLFHYHMDNRIDTNMNTIVQYPKYERA